MSVILHLFLYEVMIFSACCRKLDGARDRSSPSPLPHSHRGGHRKTRQRKLRCLVQLDAQPCEGPWHHRAFLPDGLRWTGWILQSLSVIKLPVSFCCILKNYIVSRALPLCVSLLPFSPLQIIRAYKSHCHRTAGSWSSANLWKSEPPFSGILFWLLVTFLYKK